MGRLLLHTHLGPSRPWLFAALLANEEQLAAQGTVFAPFDPAISDHVPSHRHLWPYFPAAGLSAGQKAHFARIAALLDQGRALRGPRRCSNTISGNGKARNFPGSKTITQT